MAEPFEIFFADAVTDTLLNRITYGSAGGAFIDGVDETIVVRIAFQEEWLEIGSIRLTLTGPDGLSASRLERYAPYALFGDLDGDLFSGPLLPLGDYKLDIKAYERADGLGSAQLEFSTMFELVPNRSPEADDDWIISAGSSTVFDPLDNDSDPDGDRLSLVSVGTPLGGFAVASGDSVIYGPNFIETPNGLKSFVGRDTFHYVITDGALMSTATVSVDVEGADGTDEFLVRFADARSDTILGRLQNYSNYQFDADVLDDLTVLVDLSPFARQLEQGDFQSVRLILDGGSVVRTENVAPYALFGDNTMGDFFGSGLGAGLPGWPDAHELQVQAFTKRDGGGELLANAVFKFTVSELGEVNLPPYARNDTFVVTSTSTILDVLFNDYDAELDPLTVISATNPIAGALVVENDAILYNQNLFVTPAGVTPFIGTDAFEYTITDGRAQSTARVEVVVEGVVAESEYRVEIVDVVTDNVVAAVFNDGFIELPGELRGRVGIAVTASPLAEALTPEHIASLRLSLYDGDRTISRVENDAPYALFGDVDGDFRTGSPLQERQYELTLEAFTHRNAGGDLFSIADFNFYLDYVG